MLSSFYERIGRQKVINIDTAKSGFIKKTGLGGYTSGTGSTNCIILRNTALGVDQRAFFFYTRPAYEPIIIPLSFYWLFRANSSQPAPNCQSAQIYVGPGTGFSIANNASMWNWGSDTGIDVIQTHHPDDNIDLSELGFDASPYMDNVGLVVAIRDTDPVLNNGYSFNHPRTGNCLLTSNYDMMKRSEGINNGIGYV